jgi:hypothetical protein
LRMPAVGGAGVDRSAPARRLAAHARSAQTDRQAGAQSGAGLHQRSRAAAKNWSRG